MTSPASSALADKLQSVLEGEYAGIRQRARDFMQTLELPKPGVSKEVNRAITMQSVEKMIAEGFSLMPYASEYGGQDRIEDYLNFVETMAHHDMSFVIKQGVNFGLFGMGLYSLGTKKHHEKYIPDIMQGKLLGGFAMTEICGGSDVQGIKTEAIYDHAKRRFILNTPSPDARKTYIGNAALHGRSMVVFAQLKMNKDAESQGVHAFVVPVRDLEGKLLPGVTIEDCGHKVGLNGVDNGIIHFDNVLIPYDDMLDRFATIDAKGKYQSDIQKKSARFFSMIATLVMGRVVISMTSLAGAKSALASAIPFADQRVTFKGNLLDRQASQTRLFSHLANAYGMHFATRVLMTRLRNPSRDFETVAAGLKAKSSDDAILAIDQCRLMAGGAGYISDERHGAMRSDVDIFRTFEGDNLILRMLVGKNRLSEKFGKSSMPANLVKMLSTKASGLTAKFNAASRVFKGGNLLDPSLQLQLFAAREKAMLNDMSLKGLMITLKKGRESSEQALQDDLAAYAEAYTEKIVLEEFVRAVKSQTDPQTKAALKNLCDLYAVNTLRKSGLWYVEKGFMRKAETKQLVDLAHKLGEKIRPDAVSMVRAFAIPESVIKADNSAAPVPA